MANKLAEKLTGINLRQLATCWQFKLPRMMQIRKYRRLYNGIIPPRLRTSFNVPIPIFPGMIDTLQADLDETHILKADEDDPADFKAIVKINAAIKKESTSSRPGAQWNKKFRQGRFEKIITGREVFSFSAASVIDETKGTEQYHSNLEVVPFEDFFFEPMGGGSLEGHLFTGRQNVWRTESQLRKGVEDGLYDREQVNKLLQVGGADYKRSGIWDGYLDFSNRFQPLGLMPEANNYVGEKVFHLVEFESVYEGRRWYNLFEPFMAEWIRFEKLKDINSSGGYNFISSASHEDPKNFASKSFADDLYPIADTMITLVNQDLTNRQKRNLNAKAYDKDMVKDLAKLDEAQWRPDALVPFDTKGGTRRLSEGVYEFKTPEIGGTIDMANWLESVAGRNLGVNELQQGGSQPASKKVGVIYSEMANINKRLSFMSQPELELVQELGVLFVASLKDYMREPMAIELLGETGIEWGVLERVDLDLNRNPKFSVVSQSSQNKLNEAAAGRKEKAFGMVKGSPNVNPRAFDEYVLRDIGGLPEPDIAIILDTNNDSDKETIAEAAAAVQEIMLHGKQPKMNYNADRYYINHLLDFAKEHRDTIPMKKFEMLIQTALAHEQIVIGNEKEKAARDAQRILAAQGGIPGQVPNQTPVIQ